MSRDRRAFRALFAITLVVLVVLATAAVAQAATINVTLQNDPTGAGDCTTTDQACSLRQAVIAVDGTSGGDTIVLGSGTYSLTQGSDLDITEPVTLTGAGVDATSIDGSQNSGSNPSGELGRILRVDGAFVSIQDLALTGGNDGTDENFCGGCDVINMNGGGALFNSGGNVKLQDVAFTNDSSFLGGAVSNDGILSMQNVSFTGDGGGIGGGLFSRSGSVTGTGLTFENDASSPTDEAALYLLGGTITLTNTTVAGSGGASSQGGGIHNAGANLTLTNDTLAGNNRGSLETNTGASTSVANTIIANGFSDGDGDCIASGFTDDANNGTSGTAITTDLGGNLDQDNSCGLTTDNGDLPGADPELASIADNGGPTRTDALLHGSPAFGAAKEPYCPPADQRGITRANPCDIGAFEAEFEGPPSVTTEAAQNVQETQADLVANVDFDGEAGALRFQWGTAPSDLSQSTGEIGEGKISGATSKSTTLTGLSPGTTYYYEAFADNASGSVGDGILSFTTPAGPPTISNVNVASVTDTTATIDYSIDPHGADTTYDIEYGLTSGYGQDTQTQTVLASSGPQDLETTLTNLTPGSTYHFNIFASNRVQQGVNTGDMTLATDEQVTGTVGSPVTVSASGVSGGCPTQAIIDWGDDGPSSQGRISCSPGQDDQTDFQVTAAHVYDSTGDFPVQIFVPDANLVIDQYADIAQGQSNTPAISQSAVSASFYGSNGNAGNFFSDWPGGPALWNQSFPVINFNDDPSQDPPGYCPAQSGENTIPFTDGISSNPPANTTCSYQVAENAGGTLQAGMDTSGSPGGANLSQFTSVMTGTYTVGGPGQVTFNSLDDDGFSLGIGPSNGNQPVYTSGSDDMPSGTTAVQGFDIVGSDQGSHGPTGDTFTVYFPAAGTYPFELDYDECCGGSLEMTLAVGNTVLQAPALTTTATADNPTVVPGNQDGYTITISNPNSSSVTLSDINNTLPSGFTYVAGSTTGATTSDPSVSGQTLTWNGSFAVPANGSVVLHFNVTTPSSAGGPFYDNAGGDPIGGYELTPTGDTAPITLTSPSQSASPPPSPSPSPSAPAVSGGAPTSLTVNSASASGTVNPAGAATQAYFQYGLDLSQRGPGADTTLYDQSTPPQSVGSDAVDHTVTAQLTGLIPGALYHVRLVAINAAGTTFGSDQTFTTAAAPPPPSPVVGQSENANPVTGKVFIETPSGQFIPLTGASRIPSGTVIDALHGSLRLVASVGKGKTEQGVFGGAIFKLTQSHQGLTTLSLLEGVVKGGPSYGICKTHGKAADATAAALSSKTLQLLHASAHGKFRTSGRYSAATVRGTIWTVADRCDGTLTHDVTDSVVVTDFVRHKTIILHAGQRYLALAPGQQK